MKIGHSEARPVEGYKLDFLTDPVYGLRALVVVVCIKNPLLLKYVKQRSTKKYILDIALEPIATRGP